MMNSSYISSLISTLKQTVCFDSMSSTCLSSIIASKYKNASVVCEQSATFQSCKGILGFGHEIPICSVAAAVRNVFQLEEQILFTGEVRRAAICGNLKVSNDPLDSQFTWTDSNLKPANFCTQAQNPHTLACQNGTNLIVQLDELCDASVVSTTTNPSTSQPDANVTTSQPNMTASQPDTNVTTSQPNMTASQPDTNVTTSQPDTNFTSSQQNNNVTTSLPDTNVTTSLPGNVTTGQQDTNVTTSQQDNNVTTSLPGNVTTGQQDTNVTTSQQDNNVTTSLPDNMTTSLPSSMTTSQPYATTLSQNETAFTPKPPATTQPNTTTTTKPLQNTTRSPEKTTSADRSTATTITTTNSGNSSGSLTSASSSVFHSTNNFKILFTAAESQADRLLQMTGDMSNLTSADLENLVSELEKLLSGPTVSLALGNISIHVVSNLLGASPEKMLGFSRRIIGIVDTVGLKLVVGAKAETLLSPALALSVKPADGAHFQEASFSISDPNNVQTRANSRLKRSVAAVSSIPQGSITLPSTLTQNLTSEEQNQVSRLQFNFYQKSTLFQDQALGQRKLNSGIIGASAANLSIRGLQDRVIIRLRNTVPVPANFVATCVFWDFRLKNGSGGWNSNGCIVQNTTDNETICGCNHLTSFAILLDISRQPTISLVQNTILTFITYIGCGVSAIFLSLTLLTYLAFGKLRKDIPSKILIELCFALLFLNLVFLVDAWLSLYPDAMGLCISTAWFLHYFLLVVFTWMGLEGVHMYLAIVKVFNNFMSHYMLKFSLVGWGVPMLVVIIVIAIDKNNYGLVSYGKFVDGTSDDFCWLKNDIAFYVAVVAYFCVIFVFNFIMFIIVLVQLHRVKNQNPHNNKHRTTIQDVRSVIGISILLGLTWGFAFFAWGPLNLAFMYLFAIFNSLQGFFIFVFHCAVKETVRRQWRTYLCCGRMRLLENSEWSRTATQKTTKRSPLTSVHSSHNSPRSSSFLVSNSSNGISSPFSDRTITADEDPGSDVVLNEINNQYRHQHTS
ncbi:adhesion G-protein coupled receptor G2-like [Nothobranchius furzeri]|uniref:Adhesion G-protein coupled receptor G2 n=1 Tax=Nothobranchius furzeri TaxID=105023 RepID=A0A9D2XNX2_NOTFU|nr:adhesion G-protein coupled receptor G2-like [Nothobranchius furzeri]